MTVRCTQVQDIIEPADDADRWKRAATRERFGAYQRGIAEVVANERVASATKLIFKADRSMQTAQGFGRYAKPAPILSFFFDSRCWALPSLTHLKRKAQNDRLSIDPAQ